MPKGHSEPNQISKTKISAKTAIGLEPLTVRMKLHPRRLNSARLGFEYAPGCCRLLNVFVNPDDIQLSKISTTTLKQRSLESFV